MGLDLQLLPFEHESEILTYSHTVLNCERCAELFTAILKEEKILGVPVPEKFSCYLSLLENGERGYGKCNKTPYGEQMNSMTAAQLFRFYDHEGVLQEPRNKAAWSYLFNLPPHTKVALFWS